MALLFACILAASLFTISACDKLQNLFGNDKENEIVGEYVLHEQIFTPMDENSPVKRYHIGDKGVSFSEDSWTLEFKSDKTFKLTSTEVGIEGTAEGTWQYADGDYTASVTKDDMTTSYDVTMEDKNTVVLTGDGIGLRFIRKGVTLTLGSEVGTYKLYEVIDTSGDVYSRIHDTDRGSNFTANDMVITLNKDGTLAATISGESSIGTWVKNDTYIVTTINDNTSTLTIVEDCLQLEFSASTTFVLKKV